MSTALLSSLGLDKRAPRPGEPSWLTLVRNEAALRVLHDGLPTGKTEAWRFTSLRDLTTVPFAPESSADAQAECVRWAEATLGPADGPRLFLVNGRPVGVETYAALAKDGLDVDTLGQLLADNPQRVQPYLTQHARSEHFSAINSALFEDGLHVQVKGKPSNPLHVVHVSSTGAAPSSSHTRLVFVVGTNAEFSLVETYLSKPAAQAETQALCTAVTEVCLEDGANMDHLRIIEGNDSSTHLGTLGVQQGRDSSYLSRSVVMGGKLSRVEIDSRMTGAGAQCNLEGVYHAVGSEHVAHYTTVTHEASHCGSNEEYRGLIDDNAHAVFDGTMIVKQGTVGTSAHQQNHNLLLSDTATVNTKPHLEIDSDDLTASHGATIGALAPDQLFFLRARGIGEDEARAILTFSFVRSILDRIASKPLRDRLIAKLLERLPHGQDIAEIAT